MTRQGADVDALGLTATTMATVADAIDGVRLRVDSRLDATFWIGPAADSFRTRWHGQLARGLTTTSVGLREAAATLRRESVEQIQASSAYNDDLAVNATRQGIDSRYLLVDTSGDGMAVEVFGDISTAERIGVWVPGVGTDLGEFSNPSELAASRIWGGDNNLAMIEWLGYDPPDSIPDAALDRGLEASRAAAQLNEFVSWLRTISDAHIVLGGHSYGSVVVSYAAAAGTAADELVLAGSPGVPVAGVNEFALAGASGSARNVHVIANQYDPVTLAHLVDDVLDSLLLFAPAFAPGLGSLAQASELELGGLWSAMANNPAAPDFGAEVIEGQHDGLAGVLRGTNHDYAETDSRSLRVLRALFGG